MCFKSVILYLPPIKQSHIWHLILQCFTLTTKTTRGIPSNTAPNASLTQFYQIISESLQLNILPLQFGLYLGRYKCLTGTYIFINTTVCWLSKATHFHFTGKTAWRHKDKTYCYEQMSYQYHIISKSLLRKQTWRLQETTIDVNPFC